MKKIINIIKKDLNNTSKEDLLIFDRKLTNLYNLLQSKETPENLVKTIIRKRKSTEYIKYCKYSTLIDKYIPPFTDNIMKRNINLIKIAIEQILNKDIIIIKRL
jgi:hypothetical protein